MITKQCWSVMEKVCARNFLRGCDGLSIGPYSEILEQVFVYGYLLFSNQHILFLSTKTTSTFKERCFLVQSCLYVIALHILSNISVEINNSTWPVCTIGKCLGTYTWIRRLASLMVGVVDTRFKRYLVNKHIVLVWYKPPICEFPVRK